MNFKDMLAKISSLSEATEKTKTGVKHTADAGGYGRKVDASGETDDEPKKKKGGQEKDTGPKFDTPKGDLFGRTSGDVPKGKKGTQHTKMKDADKAEKKAEKAEKKKGLKEWVAIAEATMPGAQLNVKPMPGASQLTDQTGKVLATGPADKIKAMQASAAKGEVTLGHPDEMEEGMLDQVRANRTDPNSSLNKIRSGQSTPALNNVRAGMAQRQAGTQQAVAEKDEGKPGKNFAKIAKGAAERYGSKAAGERVAGAVRAKLMKQGKIEEADLPVHDGDMGAGLGAGRSQAAFEGKKKGDGNLANNAKPYDKVTKGDVIAGRLGKDEEGGKKKVKEGMESRLKAAHHAGKSHALSKQGYNCHYDDMEEARMYHEGFKQGLDECYGQAPIQGYVGEETPTDVVDNMASYGAQDDVDEGNAFTGKLASTPTGGKFSLGGRSMTDRSSIEEDPMFESWDNQLNSLIDEFDTIQEGLNVSISKGQQGAPDSVSVTAQDGEADQLLQFIKQAGLGLFGGDEQQPGQSSPMSLQPADGGEEGEVDIGVVGDHDGMMDLIKKVTGSSAGQPSGGEITVDVDGEEGSEEPEGQEQQDDGEGQDYKDEGDSDKEETDESTCESCGMEESSCGCDHEGDTGSKEQVEEVESEDQMTYQMAEDNPPDSGAEETAATDAEISADNEAASSHGGAQNSNLEEEDELEESYANGADDTFESDIEFMTNVISGGLNGKKTTGQSTIPVVASQTSRLHSGSTTDVAESISDWKALAGIK